MKSQLPEHVSEVHTYRTIPRLLRLYGLTNPFISCLSLSTTIYSIQLPAHCPFPIKSMPRLKFANSGGTFVRRLWWTKIFGSVMYWGFLRPQTAMKEITMPTITVLQLGPMISRPNLCCQPRHWRIILPSRVFPFAFIFYSTTRSIVTPSSRLSVVPLVLALDMR